MQKELYKKWRDNSVISEEDYNERMRNLEANAQANAESKAVDDSIKIPEGKIVCPKCGFVQDSERTRCWKCGESLGE